MAFPAVRLGLAIGLAASSLLGSSTALAQQGGYDVPTLLRNDWTNSIEAKRHEEQKALQESLATSFDTSSFKIPKAEMKALRELDKAITSSKFDRAKEVLQKNRALVTSPDGRFVLGALQIQLGAKLADQTMQSAGTDLVIQSGVAPKAATPALYRNQASYALNANDLPKAEQAFSHLVTVVPNDTEALVSLAQIKSDLHKPKEAAELFEKAIQMQKAASQSVPEIWMKAAAYARSQAATKQN